MATPAALAALLWLISSAVPWPPLAGGQSGTLAPSPSMECQTSCGGVEIPFPFGIGPDHCMKNNRGFRMTCKDSGNGISKPFLGTSDLEVLSISLLQGQVQVLHHISSYCYNAETGVMDHPKVWHWDLTNSVYTFSDTANKFTVVGCRTLAYIGDRRDSANLSALYQTGCMATCFGDKVALNTCSGMGCCQTAIPRGLQYYHVWFDPRWNMSGIYDGGNGPCSFAVLMAGSNFTSLTSRANLTSSELYDSSSGRVPMVLEWTIGNDACNTAPAKPDYACVSTNSSCVDASNGRGYICNCTDGFEGNPYLPNGCQDINECLDHDDKYPCHGVCTNTNGSFTCVCPKGTTGNATVGCQKDPFPPGARMLAVILVGVLVVLIAILGIKVYLHNEKNKRQWYFEQHGGQMLSRILETDGSNIAFTLYKRGDIQKGTGGFDKSNIVGEGAHGTVYKAILGAGDRSTTVAVKRCKKIDESRKTEFVQELVVLCRVNHPNIIRLLGCCLHFEAPMLVYEFAENGTLSDLLHGQPRRPVTLATRLRIAAETAEALGHLHSPPRPTLHGDIKPQNILLDHDWVAKVSDFGCSTINDNVQVVPKGTLAYLDPEFLQDFQITDKSDVFGVVMIELLTRKNPQAKQWKNLTIMFQNSMGDFLDKGKFYFIKQMKEVPVSSSKDECDH